jgi:hypothetical protein
MIGHGSVEKQYKDLITNLNRSCLMTKSTKTSIYLPKIVNRLIGNDSNNEPSAQKISSEPMDMTANSSGLENKGDK